MTETGGAMKIFSYLTSADPALITGKTKDKRLACSPLSAKEALAGSYWMIKRIIIKFMLEERLNGLPVNSSVKR